MARSSYAAVALAAGLALDGCARSERAESSPPPAQAIEPLPSATAKPPSDDEIRALIVRLGRTSEAGLSQAIHEARALGPRAGPTVPALAKLLSHPDEHICTIATQALGAIGPDAGPAVPAILTMMSGRDDECWGVPLGEIHSIGPPAVPIVVAALGGADDDAARSLAGGLGSYAVPALTEVLGEGGKRAESASTALSGMGGDAAPAVPALVRAHREGKLNTAHFISVTERLGPVARAAAGELAAVLRRGETAEQVQREEKEHAEAASLRRDVLRALAKTGISTEILPDLVLALRVEDPGTRELAAGLVGMLGPGGAPAVPELVRELYVANRTERWAAIEALGKIGHPAVEAVPHLRMHLQGADAETRERIERALTKIEEH